MNSVRKIIKEILEEAFSGVHSLDRLSERFLDRKNIPVGYEKKGSVGEYKTVGTYNLSDGEKESIKKKYKFIEDYKFPEDEDLITLHNIKMKNCNLHFNGCTPSKLAGFSCPVVILDESEKFDIRSKLEASAPELAKQRIKSFSKAEQLFILSSTPTIEADDMSNIHYHYTRSDQRHYYIKCLKCGKDAKINFAENKTDFFIKFENDEFNRQK